MNGSCMHTNTHRDLVCLVASTVTVCVCVSRTAWVQKIKAASEEFIETEKKKREKAYQGLSLHLHILSHCSQCDASVLIDLAGLIDLCVCVCVSAARSVKASGIGRLLVTVLEATELKASKSNGERGYTHVTGCP